MQYGGELETLSITLYQLRGPPLGTSNFHLTIKIKAVVNFRPHLLATK